MNHQRLAWLHGFTGSPRAIEPVLTELRRLGHPPLEVYAPAIVGHDPRDEVGPKPFVSLPQRRKPPLSQLPFEAEVDRLAAWLLERGWQRGTVCGYSLGGRLALGLLSRHPRLVSRLFLLSVNPGLASDGARKEREISDARWIELLRREGLEAFYERWRAQPLFASQARLGPAVLQWQAQLRASHRPEGLARCLECCGLAQMPNYRALVERASVPMHWAVGSSDEKFRALAQEMITGSTCSTIEIVDGAGHNLVLEAPSAVARMFVRHECD